MVLIALSAAPAGATTNTITLGRVTLTDRVLVTIPVTVVCDPIPNAMFSELTAIVTQASGRAVAKSSDFAEGSAPKPLLFTCDGVTQNHLVLHVLPDQGSPHFHGGGAIISARFSYGTVFETDDGSTGFTPVKIRG